MNSDSLKKMSSRPSGEAVRGHRLAWFGRWIAPAATAAALVLIFVALQRARQPPPLPEDADPVVLALVIDSSDSGGDFAFYPWAMARSAAVTLSPGVADGGAVARPWDSLGARQRAVLEAFRGRWTNLAADEQQQWVALADRWLGMSRARRAEVRKQLAEFRRLPPADRVRIRRAFVQFQALPADRRAALRRRRDAATPTREAPVP
ncbi:MAG: DUF3106 domain-containing protein [Gammaproteobacteria bacterium]|jgi:hypothetical protein